MTTLAPPSPSPSPSPTTVAEMGSNHIQRRTRAVIAVIALIVVVVGVLLFMGQRDSGSITVEPSMTVSKGVGEVSSVELLQMWSEVKLPCADPLVIPGPPQNRYGLVATRDYPTAADIAAELKKITPVGDRAFIAEQLSYLNLVLTQTQGDMTITDRDTTAVIDAAGSDAARGRDALAIGQAQLLSDRTAYRKAVDNALNALSTGRAVDDPSLSGVYYYGRTCTGMDR